MELLYLDAALLAVDKPAGLATLPGRWEGSSASEENLFSLLEAAHGKLWIVHRLDKITSGVILFARNATAHRALSGMFESHLVTKYYHAICDGLPTWERHTARHRLRPNVGHRHRTAIDHTRGVPAVTHFQVMERFQAYALLEARTETGRTHQVRAHAAALGFPILADTLYGAPSTDIISRPAFHAYRLEFQFDGKLFTFTAPHPDDFVAALRKLGAGR